MAPIAKRFSGPAQQGLSETRTRRPSVEIDVDVGELGSDASAQNTPQRRRVNRFNDGSNALEECLIQYGPDCVDFRAGEVRLLLPAPLEGLRRSGAGNWLGLALPP